MDVQAVAAGQTAQMQQGPLPAVPQSSGTTDAQAGTPGAHSGALAPEVAKLFGGGHGVSVNVSYRVEHDPNMIVTVMTDPATGEVIAQIPAEVMVQIAQFFDKQTGVTLDRNA